MAKEVKIFKLINGDEIVAYATERLQGGYDVEKPRAMQVMPTHEGPQAGLVPWIITNPDVSLTLTTDKYFCAGDAPKHVEDYYLEITSSIKIASSLN